MPHDGVRPGADPRARLTLTVSLDVRVAYDGRELLRYVHLPDDPRREAPRPYLHPVRTLAGEVVTLARPHDRPWHKGLSWAIPHVGPHNLWGGPTFVDGEHKRLPVHGSIDHQHFTEIRERLDHVAVAHELLWHGRSESGLDAGPELVRERRRLFVTVAAEDVWVLALETTMTNVSGTELPLGSPATRGDEGARFGGLFWRGPRSFTGGTILLPDGAGAPGDGPRAPWAGFTGRHDETGAASTVVIVDDESNPTHPPRWHATAEPFASLGPAPFADAELAFPPDAELTFRFAVVVGDGVADVASAADLAALGREVLALAGSPAPPPTLGLFLPRLVEEVGPPPPVEGRRARRAAAAAEAAEAEAVAAEVAAAEAGEVPPPSPADEAVAVEPPAGPEPEDEAAEAGAEAVQEPEPEDEAAAEAEAGAEPGVATEPGVEPEAEVEPTPTPEPEPAPTPEPEPAPADATVVLPAPPADEEPADEAFVAPAAPEPVPAPAPPMPERRSVLRPFVAPDEPAPAPAAPSPAPAEAPSVPVGRPLWEPVRAWEPAPDGGPVAGAADRQPTGPTDGADEGVEGDDDLSGDDDLPTDEDAPPPFPRPWWSRG